LRINIDTYANDDVRQTLTHTTGLALLVYMLAYLLIALRTTYQDNWFRSCLKGLGLLVLFLPIITGAIELASHIRF